MNAPYPTPSHPVPATVATPSLAPVGVRSSRKTTWLLSLTGACFVFGGLMAMQLRAYQSVSSQREQSSEAVIRDQQRLAAIQKELAEERSRSAQMDAKTKDLMKKVAEGTQLSNKQATQLNSQIKSLQMAAGLTPIEGAGIRVVLNDNPNAVVTNDPFAPGLVHDFDVLQVVNELRAAKATAIAVNGIRITGYTPIRCVGPVIHVNWDAAAAPFRIEAVGNPDVLESALKMPGGIVENLKNQTLPVKLARVEKLSLPASNSGVPASPR